MFPNIEDLQLDSLFHASYSFSGDREGGSMKIFLKVSIKKSIERVCHITFQMENRDTQFLTEPKTASETRSQLTCNFSPEFIITLLDRPLLQRIEHIYQTRKEGLDIVQFCRFFLNCLEHSPSQTPLLAAGLRELFGAVSKGNTRVTFPQITDHICEFFLTQEGRPTNQLAARWIPVHGNNPKRLSYLNDPPEVRGGRIEQVSKVLLGSTSLDKGKHENIITQACFSPSNQKIYSLESMADWIGVYSQRTKLEHKIRPSSLKVKKDAAVLGLAFSERQQRLGAILKDYSLSFWDICDNYSFQKSISTSRYCQELQTSIWYLHFFQVWVTADSTGTLYLWNLNQQSPERALSCRHRSKVNDICEIPSIGVAAVGQEQKGLHSESARIQLLNIRKGEVVAQIDTRMQRRVLHTIRYSEQYQVLLSAGYERKINIFQINTEHLDSSLRGQLLGHESAVTCFTLIRKSPMVVSADDKGKIKIWNIRNFKCIQSFDFTDKVSITQLLDMAESRRIGVVGSRVSVLELDGDQEETVKFSGVKVGCTSEELWVLTQGDVRFYNWKSGKLKRIECGYHREGQVTVWLHLETGGVVTGNQKGEIAFYKGAQDSSPVQVGLWHKNPVQHIEEDKINDLLLTYSESGFVVLGRSKETWVEIRSMKGSALSKQCNSILFSAYHSICGFVMKGAVWICDFEEFKVFQKIVMQEDKPTCMEILNGIGVLVVGTASGNLHLFEIDSSSITFNHLMSIKLSLPSPIFIQPIFQCFSSISNLSLKHCSLAISHKGGSISSVDLTALLKSVTFKQSRTFNPFSNPKRQIKETIDGQFKKSQYLQTLVAKESVQIPSTTFTAHSGQVACMAVGEFDQHILVSTGTDKRVKIWSKGQMLADFNVNLPLPYKWEINTSKTKTDKGRVLQGLQLVDSIFNRFGKDVSAAEAQLLKTDVIKAPTDEIEVEDKRTVDPRVLFQDKFTLTDLHYSSIKRTRVMQTTGPTLRRMQVIKKIQNLRKEWKVAKQNEEGQRVQLFDHIQHRAKKIEQKDQLTNLLRPRAQPKQPPKEEVESALRGLEQRMEKWIQEGIRADGRGGRSSINKSETSQQFLKSNMYNWKHARDPNSQKTLQAYFQEKHVSAGNSPFQTTAMSTNGSPRSSMDCDKMPSNHCSKEKGFRWVLREMRDQLSRSKKMDRIGTRDSLKRVQTVSSIRRQSSQLKRRVAQHK